MCDLRRHNHETGEAAAGHAEVRQRDGRTRLDAALPILTTEPGLTQCLEEIRRSERQEECMLAKRWRE